jgi:hypothetical protein
MCSCGCSCTMPSVVTLHSLWLYVTVTETQTHLWVHMYTYRPHTHIYFLQHNRLIMNKKKTASLYWYNDTGLLPCQYQSDYQNIYRTSQVKFVICSSSSSSYSSSSPPHLQLNVIIMYRSPYLFYLLTVGVEVIFTWSQSDTHHSR